MESTPKKELSPIDVYKLLPKTNCKECGEENCMAFATKLVNREATLQQCPPILQEKYREAFSKLWEMLKPPVKEIVIGSGERAAKIGGKLVMYRHEFTYFNPTAVAIDVTDEMIEDELLKRVKDVENFTYPYIGQNLKLDAIAIRSTSNDQERFKQTVKKVIENTKLPVILCSFNPNIIESGLLVAAKSRPLIYAATKDNWKEMAELALMYDSPLAVFSPNDLRLLRSLAKTLLEFGVKDLALDPGTVPNEGLGETISNYTMLRRSACREEDEILGFPLIGGPLIVWSNTKEMPEISSWKEACLASMLISRYADLLIMHSFEGWVLLPTVILRQNLYTDPRKPVAVQPGLKTFGAADEDAPLLFTSNFALTYYTVASDIESGGVTCHLLVVDTEGLSVESSVAGRKLTADKVAEAIKTAKVEEKVKHRNLIIPGRAARLSGEIEEATGWKVLVGPLDSSGIPKLIQDLKAQPQKA